jgi:hypothetical protein
MEQARVKSGDRFRALCDIETAVLICWKAPFTSGEPCLIPAGTVLVADLDQLEGKPGFNCLPEEYEALLPVIVSEKNRSSEKFDGYYFVLLSEDIGTKLEKVESA